MNQKARAKWLYLLEEKRRNHPFGPLLIKRNAHGQIHCETGPAYVSTNLISHYIEGRRHGLTADIYGSEAYYFKGVLIPEKYALEPDSLTIEEILKHQNTEVRYAGLEIFGYDRLLAEKAFRQLHSSKKTGAKLFQYKSPALVEPLTVVMVINSTAESDGTYKRYFLSVPPTMKTCEEAIAWTFRMDAHDYAPAVET